MKKEYDFKGGTRGAVVQPSKGKMRITIRLDEDVVTWFKDQVIKGGGGNYQSLINAALHDFIKQQEVQLEETLRRVIREELKNVS